MSHKLEALRLEESHYTLTTGVDRLTDVLDDLLVSSVEHAVVLGEFTSLLKAGLRLAITFLFLVAVY